MKYKCIIEMEIEIDSPDAEAAATAAVDLIRGFSNTPIPVEVENNLGQRELFLV